VGLHFFSGHAWVIHSIRKWKSHTLFFHVMSVHLKSAVNIPYSYKRQANPEPPSNATSIAGLGIMSCCYQHQQTCHFRLLVMSVAGPVMCALLVIYIFFVILCILPGRCDNSLCHCKCVEMMQAVEEITLVEFAVGGFLLLEREEPCTENWWQNWTVVVLWTCGTNEMCELA
jgi:hypothetical protein